MDRVFETALGTLLGFALFLTVLIAVDSFGEKAEGPSTNERTAAALEKIARDCPAEFSR